MIREVDLVSYLPEFMQLYKEPIEILKAENPEFQIIWKVADKAFYNRFISTADDYGISRFENILGIYPNATDTLENRRMRLQSRWFNKIPYTIRNLAEKINNILEFISDDIQTFVTTTELDKVADKLKQNSKVFKVFNGTVEEEQYEK